MPAIALRAASLVDAEHRFPRSLQALDRTPDPLPHARESRRFELTSRGDRVPLVLWLPAAQDPAPLVWLQYGAGASIDTDHLTAVDELTRVGLAVVTLDWPLHGRRRSVKLSERLLESLATQAGDPNGAPLVEQFILQATVDLAHGIEALAALDEIRAERIALSGVGIGSHIAALVASIHAGVAALCLAPGRPMRLEAEIPLRSLLGTAKHPTLLLAGKNGSEPSQDELEALRLACAGPAELERISGRIDPLDREGARHFARFLARTLG